MKAMPAVCPLKSPGEERQLPRLLLGERVQLCLRKFCFIIQVL